jgi:hypothetical protein
MFPIASFARRATVAALSAALLAGSAGATATQGTLGATSTGIINITASVAARAQITGLQDVTFSAVDPTVAASRAQSNCVWTNTLNGGYSITATGSGSGGAFSLANTTTTTAPGVAYSVQWAATANQSTGNALTAGTAKTGLTSSATSPTCSAAPLTTSSLIINIASADLLTMTAGATYTGTLSLLVTPQ